MTIIPLKLFFNSKGIAKISIGLGKGKKLHDKRQDQKRKDWDKQKSRLLIPSARSLSACLAKTVRNMGGKC